MTRNNNELYQLSQWTEIVSQKMSHLSKPQGDLLAMYSFGMVIANRCGRTSVAAALADLLNEKEANLNSRLRDWYCEASAKPGYDAQTASGRDEVKIETCFEPWLRWIVSCWRDSTLLLALDATTLRDRFTVLSVSVVYRGNAIPVAWKILAGNEPHPWEPEWERLLHLLQPAMPTTMTVLVLTDRGLYSRKLFRTIQECHWHPFMRINSGGFFRPTGRTWRLLERFTARPGQYWCGSGTAFRSPESQLPATLLAFWAHEGKEPWLILTDLSPQAEICWYALRAWIELSFRTIKRGGLHWHLNKMTKPERAERLWLPMAMALFWEMRAGTPHDEVAITTPAPAQLPESGLPIQRTLVQQQPLPKSPVRKLSVARRGWIHTITSFILQRSVELADLLLGPLPSLFGIF